MVSPNAEKNFLLDVVGGKKLTQTILGGSRQVTDDDDDDGGNSNYKNNR